MMKSLFLAALVLGTCSNPDLEMLKSRVEQLELQQEETHTQMNQIKDFLLSRAESSQAGNLQMSVKANMHTLQTIVETYGVDEYAYPNNIAEMVTRAKAGDYYFIDRPPGITNPYTKGKETSDLFLDGVAKAPCKPGVAYYEVTERNADESPVSYEISACGEDGTPILDGDSLFLLSNS